MARKLSAGVSRYSRTQSYRLHQSFKRRYKIEAKPQAQESASKTVTVGGSKNGQTRQVPTRRSPRFYGAEDVKVPKANRKTNKITRLRTNITPGTVLVLLSGRHRGRRVVFLKQLPSGLLLVTGPYQCNRVPLKRVNQSYVIATSTKIDLAGLKLSEKLSDATFKNTASASTKKEREFFAEKKGKTEMSEELKKLQKEVDTQILAIAKKTPLLVSYLKAPFTLEKGQAPHAIKF